MSKLNCQFFKSLTKTSIEANPKWETLASYFENQGSPLESTNFEVEVFGVYAPPEDWVRKETTGIWEGWNYQFKISDLIFEEAKFNPRELTEEEKKKIEDEKNLKKKTGAKGKNDEPSKEEIEKLEKERQIQEEIRMKQEEEFNKLDEETQFYVKNENKFETPWISFLPGKNVQSIEKRGEKLEEIEEKINDEYGLFIEFNKIPPEEDPKKKKPPPKNATPEDLKPVYCSGWIYLTDFLKPGCTESIQRVKLATTETYEKITSNEPEINSVDKDYVQSAGTYIYLKITFSEPINPKLPEKFLPQVNDIAKRDQKNSQKMTDSEICADFRKQLKITIESISKEYVSFMGETAKTQLIRKEKANVISNVKKEERDSNIGKFLTSFNAQGKAELIKEKQRRYLIRIINELHKKQDITSNFQKEKDQNYSKLFAYLTDEVKLAMDEYMQMKRDDVHEDILSSYEQSRKEVMQYAARKTKEPEEKRLLRLSQEYEIMEDYEKALFYYNARLTIVSNKESLLGFAILSKKVGNLNDVEEILNDCINFENEDLKLKMLYAGIKYLKGRLNDAIFFMDNIIKNHPDKYKGTDYNFNTVLAFLYKEKGDDFKFKTHIEAAKRLRMREMNLGRVPKPKSKEKKPVLPDDKYDDIFYGLLNFFNEYHFFEICEKLIEFIKDKTNIRYMIEQAKIYLNKKEYEKAINISAEIISKDRNNYQAWLIRGHSYYFKKNLFDSEESYVRAIRCKPPTLDPQMLYRLGLTYVNRKTWEDTKVVFSKLLKDNFAFAWRFLGLAYINLKQFDFAEEALNEAILLDVENLSILGYMTVFCLKTQRFNQAFECLNEILDKDYNDIVVLNKIGKLLYKHKEIEKTIKIYQKILSIEPFNTVGILNIAEIYIRELHKYDEGKSYLNRIENSNDPNLKRKIIKLKKMYIDEEESKRKDKDRNNIDLNQNLNEESNDSIEKSQMNENLSRDLKMN